jgi:hypothetical protein
MKYHAFCGETVFETCSSRTPSFKNIRVQKLASQLITELLPEAVCKQSIILNNIHPALTVRTDDNMLAYILWNMLSGAIKSTEAKCIHLDVELHDKGIIILVQDAGNSFYKNISPEYRRVQFVAQKLGGTVSVNNKVDNTTTVTFTLFGESEAA